MGRLSTLRRCRAPSPLGCSQRREGADPRIAWRPEKCCWPTNLTKYTDLTHASGESLRAELERIRSNGYAINRGEWRSQVCGVAAPIWDHEGRVVASVGACGPIQHFSPGYVQHMIECVVATARAISEQLGWKPKRGERAAS